MATPLRFDIRNDTVVEAFRNQKQHRRIPMTTRVDPVRPPYPRDIAERLEAMMPPGAPPILLFRTFVRNLPMAAAMSGWGGYELSKRLSLSMRDREIIIDRTCARCRCEYEWGVHVAFFAERVALSGQQITSLTHGDASDPCWTDERDRLLIEAADALHDSADIGEDLWCRLARLFSDEQLLDLLMLAGWYHAISFTANAARVACEHGAPRFADAVSAPLPETDAGFGGSRRSAYGAATGDGSGRRGLPWTDP
jgi:alkylhydroperoxidase family enzyme